MCCVVCCVCCVCVVCCVLCVVRCGVVAPAKKSSTGKRPYRKGTRISDLDQTEVFTDPGKVVGRLSEIKSIRAPWCRDDLERT